MQLIEWDDSYSVNIKSIDDQHKQLIAFLNELNDAMAKGKGKETIGDILKELAEYTKYHFNHEEELFEKHGYKGTNEHKEEHKYFVNEVTNFINDYNEGKFGLSIKVMNFLKDWTLKHIKGSDQKYTEFLVAKGVS